MTALAEPSTPAPASSRGGLLAAARLMGEDLLSTLVYAALFAATRNLLLSTGVAVAAGVAGVLWTRARGRRVDAIQLLSLGLVVVFGGLGLLTHDARFVMVKPTLAYLAVAAVMLKPGWLVRYMPQVVRDHGTDLVRGCERAWAGAMGLMALANGGFALWGDVRAWAAFVAVAPLASKLVLTALTYGVIRIGVRRRVLRARAAGFTGG